MKRICHVTSAHPAEDGRIFRRACISAARAGYETFLVEQGETYSKEGVHIIGLGIPEKSGRVYRMTRFARRAYLVALSVDADLYHLHDPELLRFALKLKRCGKAVVFDSHENYEEQLKHKSYLPGCIGKMVSWLFGIYARRVFSKIDGLTYPGNEGEVSAFHGLCKRVYPTDNLPWLDELYTRYNANAEKIDNSICYIGGLSEARGITKLIEGVSDAGGVLYLAGDFDSDDYKQIVQKKEEYKCVKYLGVLGRDEITELLQKTEIGACLLLDVGQYHQMRNLPTKVYEYMSMGIPVILNTSPYNDMINNELTFGICIDPMDRKAIKEAIEKLLADPELQQKMGNNGRTAILNRFCWDKAQHNLLDMYRDILQG